MISTWRVQQAARAIRAGAVIAHRLASISGVDQIVVLDQGRVLESGRHEHLLNANGAYARLWRAGTETPAVEMSL